MRILAIETSCDDTAVAIMHARGNSITTKSQVTASQIPIHRRYGGVIPEVAARAHAETIIPTIREAFEQMGENADACMKKPPIDAIAVTSGPGLVTSLWVGVTTAKLLAREWDVPLYGVNHMVGHTYSSLVDGALPEFPALALIVSGGHTEIVFIKNKTSWKKIGATRDDAAGEAFDKFAKVLGLPYPGGPEISRRARTGNPTAISFPRPMMTDASYDFSFSGLKTAGRLWVESHHPLNEKQIADVCASYEEAIVEVLVTKMIRAVKQYKPKTILLGGGVAANDALRSRLTSVFENHTAKLLLPQKSYTTDNAAMIGAAAYFGGSKFKTTWKKLVANPNFEIEYAQDI